MMKFVFLVIAITMVIFSSRTSQAVCPCSYCSENGGRLPDTCVSDGCNAYFQLINITAFDPFLRNICATKKCITGGSCPAYSISGLNFSSSPNVDKYIGAFSAKIGTPLLEDVCWYDDSLDCPENSCAVDLRRLPVRNNTGIGVWCVTNGYNNGCPTNFTAASTQFAAYRDQMDFISGALAQSIGCSNPDFQCVQYKVTIR